MINLKTSLAFFVTLPVLAFAQDTQTHSEAGFYSGPAFAGTFNDSDGSRFFELLRSASQISQVPFSFDEVVDLSSNIATGFVTAVVQGPSYARKRRPEGQPVQTVLLKVQGITALKGDPQGVFFVQYVAPHSIVSELNAELYSRELLFLLVPASNFFGATEVLVSLTQDAENALRGGPPVYDLTSRAGLFTMTSAGRLASPLGPVKEFDELYITVESMQELASRITHIQTRSTE